MALKSFRDRNKARLGLVGLATLTAALVAVYLVGTQGLLKSRYTVTGVFADTGGLRSGNEVRLAGVRVGEVTSVEPDFHHGNVIITWKVDRDVDLGGQTRAEISASNVLGGRYLRLTGPVTRPYLAGLRAADRRIPINRTRTPVTVNDVLKSGTQTLDKLDTGTIAKIIDQISGISPQTRKRLADTLKHLTEVAGALHDSGPDLNRLVTGADRLLTLAKSKDKQLASLARNIQSLLDELGGRQSELAVLFGSGSSAVTRISTLIGDQQTKLIGLIDDLGSTVDTLTPVQGDLNTMLAWLGPTMSAFNSSNSYGPWVDAVGTQLGPLSAEDLAKLAQSMGGRK